MKFKSLLPGVLFTLLVASFSMAEPLDVLALESAPEGRYKVNLKIAGEEVAAEFEIKDGAAVCLESEKAPGTRVVKGAGGRFQLLANGVFLISLRGDGYVATQFWAFQPDGSALIKEIPDRGENQRAVPIKDE